MTGRLLPAVGSMSAGGGQLSNPQTEVAISNSAGGRAQLQCGFAFCQRNHGVRSRAACKAKVGPWRINAAVR